MSSMKDKLGDTPFGQFDLFQGRAARDEGMDLVADHAPEFMESGMRVIGNLPHGWMGIGEDIRQLALARGCPTPHKEKAWGSLVNVAVRRGLLVDTGRSAQMQDVKSHARRSPVWRRV